MHNNIILVRAYNNLVQQQILDELISKILDNSLLQSTVNIFFENYVIFKLNFTLFDKSQYFLRKYLPKSCNI